MKTLKNNKLNILCIKDWDSDSDSSHYVNSESIGNNNAPPDILNTNFKRIFRMFQDYTDTEVTEVKK